MIIGMAVGPLPAPLLKERGVFLWESALSPLGEGWGGVYYGKMLSKSPFLLSKEKS
jgi:hypothetical protein